MAMPLEAQLFGRFVLRSDGHMAWDQGLPVSYTQQLAALLILNRTGLPSEWLARLIFPHTRAPEQAIHTVQMAASTLRKHLGSKAAVRFNSQKYRLNPHLPLTADVHEFDRALATARSATGDALLESLSKAVAVYRAPLLTNWQYPWVEPIRAYYQSSYASAAAQLASVQSARGQPNDHW
jgi:DNA-binding SARP family transcriptional activator